MSVRVLVLSLRLSVACITIGPFSLSAQSLDSKRETHDPAPKSPIIAQREAVEAAMQAGLQSQAESLKRQREALVRQNASTITDPNFIVPMLPPLELPDCPPLPSKEVEALIEAAAQKHSIDPSLIRAVMKQESGFKPCALSYKGAQGLMQLMPETAYELHVADPWDPNQNVLGGALLLKRLLDKYKGDLKLVLAAYNAGTGMVDVAGGVPDPKETQDYVASIMAALGKPPSTGGPSSATTPAVPSSNATGQPQ